MSESAVDSPSRGLACVEDKEASVAIWSRQSDELGQRVTAVYAQQQRRFLVAGIVVLAWKAGWVTLPLLTVSVVAVGAISSALFYDDQANVPPDLRVSGMDEIGRDPGSVVIALPFMWLLLLLTLAVRYRRSQAGRKPVEETSIYP